MTRATFVLLTYNQEKFAAEAARAAIAQDYPNLRLILSDDCSTDGTFEQLQREAAAAHRDDVVVRRTPRNLGLIAHLYDAASLADGELIVVAAGDDISRPNRVARLVDEWRSSGADALFSNWDVIDEAGRMVRQGRPPWKSDLRLDRYFPDWMPLQITGATSAYSADVFRNLPCPAKRIFAEDLYFTLMLGAWRRPIACIDEPLVAYRSHRQALTHADRASQSLADEERRIERESARIAEVLDVFERTAKSIENDWGTIGDVDWRAVREDAHFNRFRSSWIEAGLLRRLQALGCLSAPSHRHWLLPRLFGLPVLTAIKGLAGLWRSPRASRGRHSAGSPGRGENP